MLLFCGLFHALWSVRSFVRMKRTLSRTNSRALDSSLKMSGRMS